MAHKYILLEIFSESSCPRNPIVNPKSSPPSGSSEPSEPSEVKPSNKPKQQLTGEQEENPQLLAHKPGKQSGDAKAEGDDVAQKGFAGKGYTGEYEEGKNGGKAKL